MSWHYLQGQEEASWEGSCLDGAPSALSSLMPIADPSCSPGSETESCPPSRSGMTCGPSTGDHGEGASMSSAGGSRAPISVAPTAKGKDSTALDRGCGPRWPGSLARFDPVTHSWRTRQISLERDLTVFSGDWPRWGTMRRGEFWVRLTPERHTNENGSGLWQTPVADDAVDRKIGKLNSRGEMKLSAQVLFVEMQKTTRGMVPTPRASDADRGGRGDLLQAVRGNRNSHFSSMIPTPTAVTATGGSAMCKWGGSGARKRLNEMFTTQEVNGALNPPWVEWLMGWPIGWTDCAPLATDKFRQWFDSHGKRSEAA